MAKNKESLSCNCPNDYKFINVANCPSCKSQTERDVARRIKAEIEQEFDVERQIQEHQTHFTIGVEEWQQFKKEFTSK